MSNEVKTKEKVDMDPKYITKLTVTLLVTCIIVAGLLGLVNGVTAGPIAEINQQKTEQAMAQVVSDPSSFQAVTELPQAAVDAAIAAGGTLTELYDGQGAGYVLKVVASGSQGNIEMMGGVDGDGVVTGVSIVDNSETAGIGSKVMENEPLASGTGVLDQFAGKSAADGTLAVGTNVEAITGATVSTRGVTTGVNAALAAVAALG